ncbi:MAG TPA: hypothetical protein VFS36_03015 [Chitinophagaceae bacterium]|nr:hypothetical protein [Chitinophagaceae bacterium]
MNQHEIIQTINTELALELPVQLSEDELRQQLAAYINELIIHDFNKLVVLLYRIDVSEAKLSNLLKENTKQDAGKMIAGLIIERQAQKIKTRRQFRQPDNDWSDEEKW